MKKIIYFLIFMTMKKNKLIILLTFSHDLAISIQ
jgi:hypothetical protein